MQDTDRAWLAGIIDGEGSIYAMLERNGEIQTGLNVIMTHLPTMQHISMITGSLEPRQQTPAPTNKLKAWRWTLKAQRAASVLREVLPFMVTKKHQAELFIELMSLRGRDKPNNEKPRQHELVDAIRTAKQDGTEVL